MATLVKKLVELLGSSCGLATAVKASSIKASTQPANLGHNAPFLDVFSDSRNNFLTQA
jgi:hypothetical protein